MSIAFSDGAWHIERPETELDAFVDSFITILEEQHVNYVLVSGYVAILFGRSRNSEDVDLFIEKFDLARWKALWEKLNERFEQVTPADSAEDAFNNYLNDGIALRFSQKGKPIPNVEFKFPKKELDFVSLEHPASCELNGRKYRISPIELEIAYKFYLGSDKDIEDAVHLFEACKEHLNRAELNKYIAQLGQQQKASWWIYW